MAVADELYPSTTQDGVPIPMDIIKPMGAAYLAFTSAAWASFVIPSGIALMTFFASDDCMVDFSNSATVAPVSGTYNISWMWVPKGYVKMVAVTPGTIKVRGFAASGNLVMEAVQKWTSLSFQRQTTQIVSRN